MWGDLASRGGRLGSCERAAGASSQLVTDVECPLTALSTVTNVSHSKVLMEKASNVSAGIASYTIFCFLINGLSGVSHRLQNGLDTRRCQLVSGTDVHGASASDMGGKKLISVKLWLIGQRLHESVARTVKPIPLS